MIKRISIVLINLFLMHNISSMVFDNQFMPLIQKPYMYIAEYPYHCSCDLFFATAKEAFLSDGDEGGIPLIFGPYDQAVMAQGFVAAGFPNPLPLDFQDVSKIPWNLSGKFQVEGFGFRGLFGITKHWGIGFDWAMMRINSNIVYVLNPNNSSGAMTVEEAIALDEARRAMFSAVGLSCGNSSNMGMGDLDLYMRFDWTRCYVYKMRTINLGLRLGALLPAGQVHDINNPASIPFGGNGFYGAYVSADGEFEVREDWKIGYLARLSKRFARRRDVRFPLTTPETIQVQDGNTTETRTIARVWSPLFGITTGTARIEPGLSGAFYPYFRIENMREGLGMGIQYTIMVHAQDKSSDPCVIRNAPQNEVLTGDFKSSWVMEDFSFNVFYDFGKVNSCHRFAPIVEFNWDLPVSFIAAHDVPKTHKISLAIEFAF